MATWSCLLCRIVDQSLFRPWMVTAGIFFATKELESEFARPMLACPNGISISFASSPVKRASFLLDMLSATCGGPRPRLSMLIMAQ